MKNRVVEVRDVPAKELMQNPKNWRTHPESQREALGGLLATVGIAGTLTAWDSPEGLQLIDGHLRADQDPDVVWPVAILDVTQEEADLLLASMDPLGAMAETSVTHLQELLEGITGDDDPGDDRLSGLLSILKEQAKTFDPELLPSSDSTLITDKDVDKKAGSLESQFDSSADQDNIIKVMCPECSYEFDILG